MKNLIDVIESYDEIDSTYVQYKSKNGCYVCINTLTNKIIGQKCGGIPFKNIRIIKRGK